jgi:flagellar hook protein FlgE
MLDSINVGVSGLLGYQRGLRVIANNTTNMNTPGYKSSTLQFADLFYAGTTGPSGEADQLGHGVTTTGTHLDFRQGELRQTGNDFDLALDGNGMFMLRDAQGATRYTRDGEFQLDADGALVHRGDGSKAMGVATDGTLREITTAGLRTSAGKATATARFTGNLSSTTSEQTVGSIKVFDANGAEHALSAKFTKLGPDQAQSWKVELLEGSTTVGSSQIDFNDGQPTAGTRLLAFSYTPAGQAAQPLTLDFSSDVTSFASGNLSTLVASAQDGFAPGTLAKLSFDASGAMVAAYSNGQTVQGPRLALGRFASEDAVQDLGGNLFAEANGIAWEHGAAGEGGFGSVHGGSLEMSNVDLSREFSDLVIMQRGYQAASQVVATANDMLQELFGMKQK